MLRPTIRALLLGVALALTASAGQAETADAPFNGRTIQITGTLSPTPGVFTKVFTRGDALRRGCLYIDTSGSPFQVYFGNARTPSSANALTIPAGGSFSCTSGNIVVQDDIWVASPSAASAPYLIIYQQ